MGENKASYLTKSYVDQIPASDQKDVRELKKSVGNAAGGLMQNPLGGFVRISNLPLTRSTVLTIVAQAGDTADDLTKPFTGR